MFSEMHASGNPVVSQVMGETDIFFHLCPTCLFFHEP